MADVGQELVTRISSIRGGENASAGKGGSTEAGGFEYTKLSKSLQMGQFQFTISFFPSQYPNSHARDLARLRILTYIIFQ